MIQIANVHHRLLKNNNIPTIENEIIYGPIVPVLGFAMPVGMTQQAGWMRTKKGKIK